MMLLTTAVKSARLGGGEETMVLALLSGLAILAAVFGGAVIATARARHELSPRPEAIAMGFVTNFFDTLGIGSFAPTTAWLKRGARASWA